MTMHGGWFWVIVVALAAAFGVLVYAIYDRGEHARFFGTELVVYTLAWGVVGGPSKVIFGEGPLWLGFPIPLVVAGYVVFVAGHALGLLAHVARLRIQHVPKPPKVTLWRKPTAEELRVAEAYDDQWVAEDKARVKAWRAERRRRGWHDELF